MTEDNLFSKSTMIDLLCRIEVLKQTYDDVRQSLSHMYSTSSGDNYQSAQSAIDKDNGEDPRWDFQVGEEPATETMLDTIDGDEDEDDEMTARDAKNIDFVQLGQLSASKKVLTQQAVESVLDLIPKSYLASAQHGFRSKVKKGAAAAAADTEPIVALDEDDIDISIDDDDDSLAEHVDGQPFWKANTLSMVMPRVYVFDDAAFIRPMW